MFLVTGSSGLLGPYLCDAAARFGPVTATARRGPSPCDLIVASDVEELVGKTNPEVVIHAAAMTDVDACESNPRAALRSNQQATANLISAIGSNVSFVYISTDQVYPDLAGPHGEGSEAPVNSYGRSKLAGEQEALAHPGALVLRTNLFGPSRSEGRQSLSDFVVDNLANDRAINLFRDALFSPLHMVTLSELVVELVERKIFGTYNLGSQQGLSKADFGIEIARHLGLSTETVSVVNSLGIGGRAPRPLDLRIDVGLIEEKIGRSLPTLREEILKL